MRVITRGCGDFFATLARKRRMLLQRHALRLDKSVEGGLYGRHNVVTLFEIRHALRPRLDRA